MISKITRPQIREVFMRNGAVIPADRDDLPDYVYESVFELLEMAAPTVQGEPAAWSGWGCQYPGKMPRLYGERRIAELNCDWENGDQVLHFTAAPQPLPCQECGGDGAGGEHEEDCAMAQPAEQQPDDAAVDRFAAAMKAKLNKKRQEGRGGWQSMTAEQLSALLHEHVRKGDPVDVANLAMMLHQNGQRIEQKPTPTTVSR